jgi:hypothetical protein
MTVNYPWIKRSPNGGIWCDLDCSESEATFRRRMVRDVATGRVSLASDGTSLPAKQCCNMARYVINPTQHAATCPNRMAT